MTARSRLAEALLAGVLLASLLSGCSTRGLSFVQDTRVRMNAPAQSATVRLPLRLHWEAWDFDGRFAVFVDRSPLRPGRTLDSLVAKDDPCRTTTRCPNDEWLAARDIYVVDGTSLEIPLLPDRRRDDGSQDRHQLTLVLLDRTGKRAGETAIVREFIVDRGD